MIGYEKILLYAEDNPIEQHMFTMALEEAETSFNIRFVKNGEEVLDYLLRKGQFSDKHTYPSPHLILLDWNMPGMNGLKTLEKIKSFPQLKSYPVILFSSYNDNQTLKKSYQAGANAYLMKPLELNDLITLLQSIDAFWFKKVLLPNPHLSTTND